MTPHEAANVTDEPNWIERHAANVRLFPVELDHEGFERTLREWRLFHGSKMSDGRLTPATAVDGMIGLARLGIFPPHEPRALFKEQHDSHMWLTVNQRAWRIVAIEDRTLCLDSFGDKQQIDLTRAKWGKYVEAAAAVLAARA